MSSAPNFASVALAPDVVQISTANTNRDGTGTLGTISTGTTDGVVIEKITIKATGTTTAGIVRFFVSVNTGSTKLLIDEIYVSAITPSGTVPAFVAEASSLVGLVLKNTSSILYASTNNAETFNIVVEKSGL
jgi:hypothetical protein